MPVSSKTSSKKISDTPSLDLIRAYSRNPQNKYRIENPDIQYREMNSTCADILDVFLKIQEGNILEFSFDGYMSITATAFVAITGELLEGQTIEYILGLNESFIQENIPIEVSPRRRYASLIGLLAIKNALHEYKKDLQKEDFSDIEVV